MMSDIRTQFVRSVPDHLRLAFWFALVTALMQIGVWLFARFVVHKAVFIDPQLVWTAPAANLVVFTGVALLLSAAGGLVRAVRPRGVLLGVFSTLACYSILLMLPRVHAWALLLLSVGIGAQAGRWAAARYGRLDSLIRMTSFPLTACLMVGAVLVNMQSLLDRSKGPRRAELDAADAPNVLLIIWDTVRSSSLSLYGYQRSTTPYLDEFARSGVIFEWAFATAPWTLSSHGSLFTGHYPYDLTASWNVPLDGRYPTLAEELAARGYVTGGFVANYIFGPPAYGLARGFDHYEAHPITIGTVLSVSPVINQFYGIYNRLFDAYYVPLERSAADINRSFWRWRDGIGDRPYFAFLNYFDAHEPYTPPAPYDRVFGESQVRTVINTRRPSDSEIHEAQVAYDGAIAYLDEQLRLLITEIERRGELDRTLIIITSDHGEHMGEHGLLDHGNTLYPPLLRVPLVLRMPSRLPVAQRVPHAISLRDLPQTVFDVLGFSPRRAFPGRSLARVWRETSAKPAPDTVLAQVPFAPNQPEWYPLANGDMRSVVLWPYQLVVDGEGQEQVFNLTEDPHGLEDALPRVPADELDGLRGALSAFPKRVRAHEQEPIAAEGKQ